MKTEPRSKQQKILRVCLAALIVSIIVNIVQASIIIFDKVAAEATSEVLNDKYLTVNNGFQTFCSDEFQVMVEEQYRSQDNMTENDIAISAAHADFVCGQNGSAPYFENGIKNYLDSLGIKYDEDSF